MQTLLVSVAVVVVVVLALIAGVLHYRLYRQRQAQAREHQALAEQGLAQRERVNRSIQIIAQAVQGEELTLTEASIRISVLLDSLSVEESVRTEFAAFYQLAKATEHIPILKAWKALARPQQRAFDREREQAEAQYRDFVLDAAQRIQGRQF